jgi:hypothetical protein
MTHRLAQLVDNEELLPRGWAIVGDKAFTKLRRPGRFYAVMKDDELMRLPRDERKESKARNALLTSVRVSAEWGVGSLKRSFGRLRTLLPAHRPAYRRKLIETCVFLFNVRARLVGVNQIKTVYGVLDHYRGPDDGDQALTWYKQHALWEEEP